MPGSKSHTNRALVCAALADGPSTLNGVLRADDTEAMIDSITGLGVAVEWGDDPTEVVVQGGPVIDGRERLLVDARQSGTTSRFLLPLLAATPGRFVLDGHEQMRARPFGPQLTALRSVGAEIEGDALPLTIDGRTLTGGTITVSGSMSSQFLSGLLLSAPLLSGGTTIEVDGELVSKPYVELTLDTMARFGVEAEAAADLARFDIPGRPYRATDFTVEPDASAASYFFGAAAITGGRVRVIGLGPDTVQGDIGFVRVLESMGATVNHGPGWTEVIGPERLQGITVDMADISDTAQTLAVVAAFAEGPTEVTGIGFIRFKETDRIAAVETELRRLGLDVRSTDDGWVIHPGDPKPGTVETYEDHRMAMSFALLGLRHPGIEIADPGCVAKTFPDFFDVLDRLRAP